MEAAPEIAGCTVRHVVNSVEVWDGVISVEQQTHIRCALSWQELWDEIRTYHLPHIPPASQIEAELKAVCHN